MAYNVNFLKGTAQSFADLAVKSKNTFYYIDEKDLYIGDVKLTNGEDLAAAVLDIAQNKGDIEIIKAQIEDLTGTGGEGDNSSITDLISDLSARLTVNEQALAAEVTRATGKENELSASIEQNSTDLASLSELVNTNETDIETKVSNLSSRVSTNEQNISSASELLMSTISKVDKQATTITTVQGDIEELNSIVNTLVGTDVDKSVRAIAIEVLAEQLLADGLTENFATLQELAAWLADHPEEAAEMNAAIQANTSAITALQGTVGSHTTSIEGMLKTLQDIQDENTGILALANQHTNTEVQKVATDLSEYKTDNATRLEELGGSITSTSNSLAQAQEQLAALQRSLGTAAYKNVEDFDAAGSAAAALDEAKAYTDVALTWGQIQ